MSAAPVRPPDRTSSLIRLDAAVAPEARPAFGDLSDYFNPFLPHFVTAALRGGGEVWTSTAGSGVEGLLLYNDVERMGSIFTRNPSVAEQLFALKEPVAMFSDYPLAPRTEVYHVYRTTSAASAFAHRFRHSVRLAQSRDQSAVLRLMKELYGRIDTSWLPVLPSAEEKCLLVEMAGEIVGVGWVTVVEGHGRLHSLSVRPHYRRMGIGGDLWHARVLWAFRAGAREVLSEIADQNVASRAIATSGGMQRVGQLLLSYRRETSPTPPPGSG